MSTRRDCCGDPMGLDTSGSPNEGYVVAEGVRVSILHNLTLQDRTVA